MGHAAVKNRPEPRRRRAPASLTVRWREKCPVRTSQSAVARSSAGQVGDALRRCGSASATAVWANSFRTLPPLPQPSRSASRRDKRWDAPRCRLRYTAGLHLSRVPDQQSSYIRLKLYWNCAVNRLWPLNRPKPLQLVAAHNLDRLQLHEVLLGPRRIKHQRREHREGPPLRLIDHRPGRLDVFPEKARPDARQREYTRS